MEDKSSKTILLVEDDKFITHIYETNLKHAGYTVDCTYDGVEAIEYLQNKAKPDLILLDLLMPRKSGFEVLDFIKETPALIDVHVLILTNFEENGLDQKETTRAYECLIKANKSMAEILKKVEEYLG